MVEPLNYSLGESYESLPWVFWLPQIHGVENSVSPALVQPPQRFVLGNDRMGYLLDAIEDKKGFLPDMYLDGSNVSSVDSCGLGEMIRVGDILSRRGRKLGICNAGCFQHVLEVTRLASLFPRFENVDEVIRQYVVNDSAR